MDCTSESALYCIREKGLLWAATSSTIRALRGGRPVENRRSVVHGPLQAQQKSLFGGGQNGQASDVRADPTLSWLSECPTKRKVALRSVYLTGMSAAKGMWRPASPPYSSMVSALANARVLLRNSTVKKSALRQWVIPFLSWIRNLSASKTNPLPIWWSFSSSMASTTSSERSALGRRWCFVPFPSTEKG